VPAPRECSVARKTQIAHSAKSAPFGWQLTTSRKNIMRDERQYFIYIMSSASKTIYTGMTNNLLRRVRQHKEKLIGGFTTKYNITRLVYFESFRYVQNAIEREKQIKSWTRAKRVALIEFRQSQVE
jgi:putative endonuclease